MGTLEADKKDAPRERERETVVRQARDVESGHDDVFFGPFSSFTRATSFYNL
jgi:hypothetical protein